MFQIDFDPLEKSLADLLARHDQNRSRKHWHYDELFDRLAKRQLEGALAQAQEEGTLTAEKVIEAWHQGNTTINPGLVMAVETAFLGEANLPWYAENLNQYLASGHPLLKDFFRRWVAEEDQHGRILEIYLLFNRTADGAKLLNNKQDMLRAGRPSVADNAFEIIVYTSIQELSTRVFYSRLAQAVGVSDPLLVEILNRIQVDETLHFSFFRDAVRACLRKNPRLKTVVLQSLLNYREPVGVLPDYEMRKEAIWQLGVSNIDVFAREVVTPLMRYWELEEAAPVASRWRVKPVNIPVNIPAGRNPNVPSTMLPPLQKTDSGNWIFPAS